MTVPTITAPAPTLAEQIAATVTAHPAVARLDGGVLGAVPTRLPGTRLPGTRLPGTRLPGTRLPGTRLVGVRIGA